MTTTELGACEWFVWDLRRSNLMDRGQLDQVVGDFLKKTPQAEPPALAQYLVDQGILSPFQADRLLQGKTQGLVLGPYTLMDALGSGSMGTVYKAVSKNDNKWYAVKVLPRRSMWNVRIARRQVRSFEQVRHPSVVPFVDVGTAGGTHYLAWPFIEGETLDKLVEQKGPLEPSMLAYFAVQAAEGLEQCHHNDLFHGLLKPSSLMIGVDQQIYILDFGIGALLASSEGESLVDTMSTANTLTSGLDCASPESILEPTKRTPAGDQYSLGCTLYFCLTGRYPFPDGSAVEKMTAHQTKAPPPIKDLNGQAPDELVAVVNRLLEKEPEKRYESMAEMVEALKPLAATPSTLAPRALVRPGKPAPRRRPDPTAPGQRPPSSSGFQVGAQATNGALPTRASLRNVPVVETPVPANVAPEPSARPGPRPFVGPETYSPSKTLEERIGPIGLFVGALVAAVATWLLSSTLFK